MARENGRKIDRDSRKQNEKEERNNQVIKTGSKERRIKQSSEGNSSDKTRRNK
jgi:uncharacterized protein YabE (DUF348 family)